MALSKRNKNGIVCLVIAIIFFGVAIQDTFFDGNIPVSHHSGLGISRMVGSFLPGVLLATAAVWLFWNPKS